MDNYELIEEYLQEAVNNDIYTEEFANEILELAYDKYIIEETDDNADSLQKKKNEIKEKKKKLRKKIIIAIALIAATKFIYEKIKDPKYKEDVKKKEIELQNTCDNINKYIDSIDLNKINDIDTAVNITDKLLSSYEDVCNAYDSYYDKTKKLKVYFNNNKYRDDQNNFTKSIDTRDRIIDTQRKVFNDQTNKIDSKEDNKTFGEKLNKVYSKYNSL